MKMNELSITSIESLGGYRLKVNFSNGKSNTIDFEPWIRSLPTEEERTYLEPSRFKQYKVHLGHAISWGEFDIIFPITALYHGNPELLQQGVPVDTTKRSVVRRKRSVAGHKSTSLKLSLIHISEPTRPY